MLASKLIFNLYLRFNWELQTLFIFFALVQQIVGGLKHAL